MGRNVLLKYVKRSWIRLAAEFAVYRLQTALFAAAFAALLFLSATRLFILPFYERYVLLSALAVFLLAVLYIVLHLPKRADAINRLDHYFSHNVFISALSIDEKENPLATSLIEMAGNESKGAFDRFKKRPKKYMNGKMMSGFFIVLALIAVMFAFPSASQQEAVAIEKERDIIKQAEKKVEQLAEDEKIPVVKKELEQLAESLKKAETSEKVLKEMIKKQKEMKLKEKQLAKQKMEGEQSSAADKLTKEQMDELDSLLESSNQLAKEIGKTYQSLSKIGKNSTLSNLANAGELKDQLDSQKNEQIDQNKEETGNKSLDGNKQQSEGETPSKNESPGQNGEPGQNDNKGRQGQGSGQGTGQGTGHGAEGKGSGNSSGNSEGEGGNGRGNGTGKGQGGRELLSIPSDRIGGKTDPSIVKGEHGEGEYLEERETNTAVQRGSVRPYSEVIGNYKDAYLSSSGKMNLPSDLQEVVTSYFSSIE